MVDDFIPDFSEDEELEPGVVAEQTQNRTFLIAAGILAAVFVLGLLVAVLVILDGGGAGNEIEQTRQAIEQANADNMTFAAQTEVAAQASPTSPATETNPPTETLELAITDTPTPVVAVTQATEPPAIMATLDETQVAEGTTTPFQMVAPALEVTQLGGTAAATTAPSTSIDPTPTRIVGGINGGSTGGSTTGGTVATALPDTGFATRTPLAAIGLLGMALVAVVFVARRLRVT